MPRQPDDPHVVGEVLAPKLGTDPNIAADVEDLLLELEIAERPAMFVPTGRQRIQVVGASQLDGLERELGRRAPYDEREVVRRARSGTDAPHLLLGKREQRLRV